MSQWIFGLMGGVGLFILGMWLMTSGLRIAAGERLRRILRTSTGRPLQALITGIGLTALVQSSSAVTVAAIGFVNAGLLKLRSAVWVICGCNIGTTMTAWLVAMAGLDVDIARIVLPLIGVGMFIHLVRRDSRLAAAGLALAGFAIIFLGIGTLKENFSEVAVQIQSGLPDINNWYAIPIYFLAGTLTTLLVQSSSLTSALAISAAAAGALGLPQAALIIIGADMGTTSTAALSSIGATANARRAAASHVCINVLTSTLAILMMPLLLPACAFVAKGLGVSNPAGFTLAIFQTSFNIIGIGVIVPLIPSMVRFLERRFHTQLDDQVRLQHIDATLLEVPALAIRGLYLETERVTRVLGRFRPDQTPGSSYEAMQGMIDQIKDFIERFNRGSLPDTTAQALAELIRALQNLEDQVAALTRIGPQLKALPQGIDARDELSKMLELLPATAPPEDRWDDLDLSVAYAGLRKMHREFKTRMLGEGASGKRTIDSVAEFIDVADQIVLAFDLGCRALERLRMVRGLSVERLGEDVQTAPGSGSGSVKLVDSGIPKQEFQ